MKTRSYFQSMLPLWLVAFLIFLAFPLFAQQKTLSHSTAEEDLTTAKATVDAYEEQDWDKLRNYLDPDAIIFGLASFDSLNVEETLSYWSKGSKAAKPELDNQTWLAVSITEGPRKGNWVYTWGRNTLNYATGETISFPYHLALRIEDNKVAEAHFYYDNNKIIREMGYAISPPIEELDSLQEGIELQPENPDADN